MIERTGVVGAIGLATPATGDSSLVDPAAGDADSK
jgi:hypothetical protein